MEKTGNLEVLGLLRSRQRESLLSHSPLGPRARGWAPAPESSHGSEMRSGWSSQLCRCPCGFSFLRPDHQHLLSAHVSSQKAVPVWSLFSPVGQRCLVNASVAVVLAQKEV